MEMSKKEVKFFYLPFNRDVLLGIIGFIILISFGATNFDSARLPEERSVFTAQVQQPYYQGTTDKKQVAFKINVAWGEDHLPQMLNILEENNIKATFFLVGQWVEKFPQLASEIKERGHEIGNHGFDHSHPTELSIEELKKLIKKNEELLEDIVGYKPELFAPPYGEVNEDVVKAAEELGYKTVLWSTDTIDWQKPEPEVIVERATKEIEKGEIILIHPTEPTVEALPQLISELRGPGYELVTISKLLE